MGKAAICEQGRGPLQKPVTPALSSWTSSLQNHESIHFCCLRHTAPDILFWKAEKTNEPSISWEMKK
jgi:hypothetical protein